MPSAQVINFGEDPYANAMGTFARNFLTELNEKSGQRRNEGIFEKIKQKYGKDAKPEDIFRDVLEHEGLDQEYKRNKLNEIKDYAELATKAKKTAYDEAMLEIRQEELNLKKNKLNEEDKPITPYQKRVLENQETRLELERTRLEQAAKQQDEKLPKYIDEYSTNLLKNANVSLPAHDKADLNSFVEQLMAEDGLGVNEAFNRAYNYIQARREKIDEVQITPRPSKWIGEASGEEIEQSMDKAYQQLKALHDEDGIDNQKELREIASRAGWQPEEITKMLQRIFQRSGKSLSGRPVKGSKVEGAQQGVSAEVGGLDDILFGE